MAETLSTTSQVKLIDKWETAKTALDENFEIFVVYITTLKLPIALPIDLSKVFQV